MAANSCHGRFFSTFSSLIIIIMALILETTLMALATSAASTTTFTLHNKCTHTVWPGIQPTAGKPLLANGGFRLLPNQAITLHPPENWSGRFWGRQDCIFDSTGTGHCSTGDCGTGLFCNGLGGAPPATLAEITLGGGGGQTQLLDFYDVSLVDGYNMAVSITPVRGKSGGQCSSAGCVRDLNQVCPAGLQVRSRDGRQVVACKSACSAFNSPMYCCTGSYGSPQSCKPTSYSRLFKSACPKAYSYAYDDPTSIATCAGSGTYIIRFC